MTQKVMQSVCSSIGTKGGGQFSSTASRRSRFSSTRQTGGPQASRRVYPFSSTAGIHIVHRKKKITISRRPGIGVAKSYLVSLNNATLFSPLSTKMFSQSLSINMLFTFFSNQSSSITVFLTDPSSYLSFSLP